MAGTKRNAGPSESEPRGLQLREDPRFQARDWRLQRIGWGVLGLLVLAGLLGLTGSGPLSQVVQDNGQGLTVEYDRIVRHGSRETLDVRVDAAAVAGGAARIRISSRFLDAHEVRSIFPEPRASHPRGREVEFVFDTRPGEGLAMRLHLEPGALGHASGSIRLDEGPAVPVDQFTLP